MLWMEGFDGPGTIAALATKLAFTATAGLSLESALSGTGSSLKYAEPTHTRYFLVDVGDLNELYINFAVKWEPGASFPSSQVKIFEFYNSSTVHVVLRVDNNGTELACYRTTTLLASTAIITGTVYHGRLYFKVGDADGRVVLYLNGNKVIDFTGDTKNLSTTTVTSIRVYLSDYGSSTTYAAFTWDHLIISDFELPECTITTLRPAADGNYTQFTPSTGSDHYALVDEATLDVADYNASSTSGHRDSFKFAEPAFTGDIKGAALEFYVNKSDAGARAIRGFVRQGGTDYDGSADLTLSEAGNIASQYYEANPATSAAFTVSELTGASRTEFGIKVQS